MRVSTQIGSGVLLLICLSCNVSQAVFTSTNYKNTTGVQVFDWHVTTNAGPPPSITSVSGLTIIGSHPWNQDPGLTAISASLSTPATGGFPVGNNELLGVTINFDAGSFSNYTWWWTDAAGAQVGSKNLVPEPGTPTLLALASLLGLRRRNRTA
jgi:hypothetical protein